MREIIESTKFKRDLKKIASSGRHSRDGFRECHIKPDWLLIYKKQDKELYLVRTGSHSELFS